MIYSSFYVYLILICIFGDTSSIYYLPQAKKCSWIRNVSDAEQIGRHKYIILEECLYYKLATVAYKRFGLNDAISALPPTKKGQDKVQVKVLGSILNEIYLAPAQYEMKILGALDVSWNDYRLQWNPGDWKVDTLNIKSSSHIWVPEINVRKATTLWRNGDYVLLRDIKTTWKGNVTARLEFNLFAMCQTDHRRYPMENVQCCADFDFLLADDMLEYVINDHSGHLNVERGRMKEWNVKSFGVTNEVNSQTKQHRLMVCLSASRSSPTLKLELMGPMLVSAALVVVSPLFGTMQAQLYVKLFAVLLQFLCFQFLVERTPQAGMGESVPKIYQFYEFTFATTILSLLVTLILRALSKMERSIPPSHKLQLMASALNKYLCCYAGGDLDEGVNAGVHSFGINNGVHSSFVGVNGVNHAIDNSKIMTAESTIKIKGMYNREWTVMFVGFNNLFSFVIMAVYVIVVFVIML